MPQSADVAGLDGSSHLFKTPFKAEHGEKKSQPWCISAMRAFYFGLLLFIATGEL